MIHAKSGFKPIYRAWFKHDYFSVVRFYTSDDDGTLEETLAKQDPATAATKYDNIPVEELQYGHLVVKLFLSRWCLLTIWQGENAIETLLKIKGATQPALADIGTIRGSFWCDNGVCNLTHSSDSVDEAKRELKALDKLSILDDGIGKPLPLMQPRDAPGHYIAHSGIAIMCDVVRRMMHTESDDVADNYELPAPGDAKESNQVLTAWLQNAGQNLSSDRLSQFVAAYLAGDIVRVTETMATIPLTVWEQFVVQCGAINRNEWLVDE